MFAQQLVLIESDISINW